MDKGMKMKKGIKVIVVFALCFIGLGMNAQSSKLHFLGTVGITTPILDNGVGVTLGFNPSYAVGEIFSVEGHVSYTFTKVSGTFMGGGKATVNELSACIGPRVYFNKADKKTRFYINLLYGITLEEDTDRSDVFKDSYQLSPGLTTGFYVERGPMVCGIAFQSTFSYALKIGYQF